MMLKTLSANFNDNIDGSKGTREPISPRIGASTHFLNRLATTNESEPSQKNHLEIVKNDTADIIIRALNQKSAEYKIILISEISIDKVNCHATKNGKRKNYIIDLKTWDIKSEKTSTSWCRTILTKDRSKFEQIIMDYLINHTDQSNSELEKMINANLEKTDSALYNQQNINDNELKVPFKTNANNTNLLIFERKKQIIILKYKRIDSQKNERWEQYKKIDLPEEKRWKLEKLIQLNEKAITNLTFLSKDSHKIPPETILRLLLKKYGQLFVSKNPSNMNNKTITAICPTEHFALDNTKIEEQFREILEIPDSPKQYNITETRYGRSDTIDSILKSVGISREKNVRYPIQWNEEGNVTKSIAHSNNDFYTEQIIKNETDKLNFRLLIDGAQSATNKDYPHAKKIHDFFKSKDGINLLTDRVISELLKRNIDQAIMELSEMVRKKLSEQYKKDEFTFCMCIQVNDIIHTFFRGDTHALFHLQNGNTFWLSPDSTNTDSNHSSSENLSTSTHSTAALSIDESNHDISYTADPSGIRPSGEWQLSHTELRLSGNGILTMFSDGLGDLIIDNAGREKQNNYTQSKTFTKIDLQGFREIFKCSKDSAQKTFHLLMMFHNHLKQFKKDDLSVIVSDIKPPPILEDFSICNLGLGLSYDDYELNRTRHGEQ